MENKNESKLHRESKTTVKVDAGYRKYHCGFFCQRTIESDVVDPIVKKNNVENMPTLKKGGI